MPTQNERDPNAALAESLVAWMTRQDPDLRDTLERTREAARGMAATLVEKNGFDGGSAIDSARLPANGAPIFTQGERSAAIASDDWGKIRLDLRFDGVKTDTSLRFEADPQTGNREVTGDSTTRLNQNTTLGTDFRLGNFGTRTFGLNLDGLNTDGTLRFNDTAENGNRELLGTGSTRLDANTTLGGDFRLGNFGTNTFGLSLDGRNTDGSLRFNVDSQNGKREWIGQGSTLLNGTDRLAGDFRLGNFGANTFGINFNRGNDLNGFDLGAMVRTRDGATPGQFDIRGEYRFSSPDDRLNYAVNGRLGSESQIGGRMSYRPNEDFRLEASGAYNFATNVGRFSLDAALAPKGRDLNAFVRASIDTQGQSSVMAGVSFTFGGGGGRSRRESSGSRDWDTERLMGLQQQRERERVSDVDRGIAGLRGNDRQLYDDALVQVTRLNQQGANLPLRESALGLAAMAEKKGLNIADARVMTGNDGRQTVWVGDRSLEDPAVKSFGIARDDLARTQPMQALSDLRTQQGMQQPEVSGRQNAQPQPEFNTLEQSLAAQRTAGIGGR